MRKQFLTYILLLLSTTLVAQESKIIVSEDTIAHQSTDYDRLFSLLSEDRTKIKTLFKFNGVDWGQLHPSFSTETFLTRNLSLEPGVRLLNFGVKNQNGIQYLLEPSLIGKYYYNFNRREQLGRNINRFSGNYFFTGLAIPFSDNEEWHTQHMESSYLLKGSDPIEGTTTFYSGAWQIGYGLQRRIANFGYIDIRGGYVQGLFGNTSLSKRSTTFHVKQIDDLFKGNLFIKIDIGFSITRKTYHELID